MDSNRCCYSCDELGLFQRDRRHYSSIDHKLKLKEDPRLLCHIGRCTFMDQVFFLLFSSAANI